MEWSGDIHVSDLVLRCRLRDEQAFEEIVGLYHNRLLYYVRRLQRTPEMEEDTMQNVWLAAWQRFPSLQRPEAFSVWIYRIARNQAIGTLRRRQKEDKATGELEFAEEPEESHFTEEDAAKIHQALERVPVSQRESLVLRFLEDISYAEIAAVIGCSVGTVRSRLHYGKIALRRAMEEIRHE